MRAFPVVALMLLVSVGAAGCLRDLVEGLPETSPHDYIRDEDFSTWRIEVDHVQGAAPSQQALDTLRSRLQEVVRKETISIQVSPQALSAGDGSWTESEILDLHRRSQDEERGGGQVVTHVLYLDGRMATSEGSRVLGVAFDYDLVAIFPDEIERACTPQNLCFLSDLDIERAVLVHEFGHAMGLVNRGIAMTKDREHPESDHHSTNRDSVMYYAVDSFGSVAGLGNSIPTRFDADDKADLCQAGGRC